MYTVKEIIGDVVIFAPQIEPCCSTINNLQGKIHTQFASYSIHIKIDI